MVFHYFHHPFWGTPIFGNSHILKNLFFFFFGAAETLVLDLGQGDKDGMMPLHWAADRGDLEMVPSLFYRRDRWWSVLLERFFFCCHFSFGVGDIEKNAIYVWLKELLSRHLGSEFFLVAGVMFFVVWLGCWANSYISFRELRRGLGEWKIHFCATDSTPEKWRWTHGPRKRRFGRFYESINWKGSCHWFSLRFAALEICPKWWNHNRFFQTELHVKQVQLLLARDLGSCLVGQNGGFNPGRFLKLVVHHEIWQKTHPGTFSA